MRRPRPSPTPNPRRGLTLLEMLVVVALVVLIMTILVTIFQAATGAMLASRAYQEINEDLRRFDTTIRQDLAGATAHFTPPLDPRDGLGYFEYGENTRADVQGEDGDDYLAFTARAPEGQPFVGRLWVSTTLNAAIQPVQVTSEYAEIVYFLRGGNLYRRVFLVKPELNDPLREASLGAVTTSVLSSAASYNRNDFGTGSSTRPTWRAFNDISARPSMSSTTTVPIANTLGDLTNRENRAFRPRFTNDYLLNTANTATYTPDGTFDDRNPDASNNPTGNGIADWYPTLYPNLLGNSANLIPHQYPGANSPEPLVFDYSFARTPTPTYDTMAFPYIFPGAYTNSYNVNTSSVNGVHVPLASSPPKNLTNNSTTVRYINHNPLGGGADNWFTPDPQDAANQFRTWFGFPTWRETAIISTSLAGPDPIWSINVSGGTTYRQAVGLSWLDRTGTFNEHLPWDFPTPPPFSDANTTNPGVYANVLLADGAWEEDLILTNVRSFDVKAFDPILQLYMDLGHGNTDGINPAGFTPLTTTTFTPMASPPSNPPTNPPLLNWFGHEGRIPPFWEDGRQDAQVPRDYYGTPYLIYDQNPTTIRLQRVYDTWSTDYTRAPDAPPAQLVLPGYQRPFYPSFPPPYPVPLRGIQITIKVTDPRGERLRPLTIRQDFTNKL